MGCPDITFSGTSTRSNTYQVTISADDGFLGVVSLSFPIKVGTGIPNTAPVVNQGLGSHTAEVGKLFSYTISKTAFTDADNDQLYFNVL